MGIENRNGILSGIDNEKAQQIRQAILDGTLTNEEAKKLGLTPEEQKYLQDAFNFGEVQIGDRLVVKNFGSEKDVYGEKNYHLTQTANRGTYQIEGSKVGYSVTEHNLNTDEVETRYYTDADEEISKAEYKDLQKGVKFFTAPDGNGYVGVSFKDRTDKNGNVLLDKDGKAEQEPVITYYSKELIPISEKMFNQMTELNGAVYNPLTNEVVLHHSKVVDATNPLDLVKTILGGSYACSDGLVSIKQDVDVDIKVSTSLSEVKAELQKLTQLTEDMLGILKQNLMWHIKNGESLDAILDAYGVNNMLLRQILDELTKGNQLLLDIRNGMETNNKQNDEILKVTVQILQKLTNIENSVNSIKAKFPDLSAQLTAILNAIKNNQGGTSDPTEILAKLDKIISLLDAIANSSKVTEATAKAILDAINKLSADQAANFVKVINAINNLGNKLTNLQPLLDEILEAINNNTKNDDKNAQLILDAIANLKLNGGNVDLSTVTQLLKDIKDMFSNCLGKFNALLAKLENYHGDIVDLLNKILDAIKNHTCNCNCGNGSHEGILDNIDGLIS